MEDKHIRRQKRLRQLIQTRFDGKQSRFAEAADIKPAYVSFLLADRELKHHKNLGEDLAQQIEKALGLEPGWFDADENGTGQEVIPQGFTPVSRRQVRFSAGNGSMVFQEEAAPPLAFRTDWLSKRGLRPQHLVVSYVKGDSMSPTLDHDDTILINLDDTRVSDNNIYAFRYGDELRIKRIFKRIDSLLLHSDNPLYPDEEITRERAEHLQIIGRVIWSAGDL